jgi:hypothetical protein
VKTLPSHRGGGRVLGGRGPGPQLQYMAAGGLLQRTDGPGNSSWDFYDVRLLNTSDRRPTYKGLRGWRGLMEAGFMAKDPAARPGGPFQEVPLRHCTSSEAEPLLHDSIMLLPELVSAEECAHLRAAADRWCESEEWSGVPIRRIECHPDGVNLDGRTHALAHIILSRALWSLEVLHPELAAELFPEPCDCCDLWMRFSGQEPMLNRYTLGGGFEPHQDGHALTVLVPLSTADADFVGGGTAFWSEATIGCDSTAAKSVPPSLIMRPPIGTGLFWRGHLTHAGLPISSGTRHVFVASFNLCLPGTRG